MQSIPRSFDSLPRPPCPSLKLQRSTAVEATKRELRELWVIRRATVLYCFLCFACSCLLLLAFLPICLDSRFPNSRLLSHRILLRKELITRLTKKVRLQISSGVLSMQHHDLKP